MPFPFQYARCRARPYWLGRARVWMLWWAIASVLGSPIGATLHAAEHMEATLAAQHREAGQPGGADGRLDHCHSCGAWNALDSVLPATLPSMGGCEASNDHPISFSRSIDIAGVCWYMQRAPPPFA